MNRTLLVVLGLLVVALIVVWGFVLFSLQRGEEGTPVPNPFGGTVTEPGGRESGREMGITIPARDGSPVTVSNFIADREPVAVIDGAAYYDLVHEGPVYGNEEEPFLIQYDEASASFTVLLVRESLAAAREAAELYLMTLLGVGERELCQLSITVAVTEDFNPVYGAYENLGVSACPGAVELP